MLRMIMNFIFAIFILLNLSGCVAVLAGAAGGAGTAVWLSEKLTQEVNSPFERTIQAVKFALKSLRLEVTKETVEQDIAQIMSKYTDGKTIWIDVRRITEHSSKVEVRVGAINSDKEAADKILKRVLRYL